VLSDRWQKRIKGDAVDFGVLAILHPDDRIIFDQLYANRTPNTEGEYHIGWYYKQEYFQVVVEERILNVYYKNIISM